MTPRDDELVRQCQDGDRQAFDRLYDLYGPRVYGWLRRMSFSREDAEDLTQEVFVQTFLSIGRFHRRSSLGTWLYRVMVNVSSKARRRARPDSLPLEDDWVADPAAVAPEEAVVAAEESRALQAAVVKLPDDLRSVLLLVGIDGLSYAQASRALGIPLGTVQSRLHVARRRLADLWQEHLQAGSSPTRSAGGNRNDVP